MKHRTRIIDLLTMLGTLALCACGSTAPAPGVCSGAPCEGCCLNGVCQPGDTATACGNGGQRCSACDRDQICGAERICVFDPEGVWLVQPGNATLAPNNGGNPWDPDGSAPDPFVRAWCPGEQSPTRTPTDPDTLEPSWYSGGCTAFAKDLLANGFSLQVVDDDGDAEEVVTNVFQVTVPRNHLLAGGTTLGVTDAMQSLTVRYQKQ